MPNHPGRNPWPRLPDTLPQALAEARLRAGLSPADAARLIGAGARTWQQWEAAQRSLPWSALSLWLITAVADGLLPLDDPLAVLMVRPSILARMGATRE